MAALADAVEQVAGAEMAVAPPRSSGASLIQSRWASAPEAASGRWRYQARHTVRYELGARQVARRCPLVGSAEYIEKLETEQKRATVDCLTENHRERSDRIAMESNVAFADALAAERRL